MDQEKIMTSGIKKFDGTEFDVWSTLQEVYLTAKGIWYVIDQEKPEGEDRKWDHDNKQAKMALLWSLEHEVVKLVISCDTARDIWNRLKSVHAQKSESCRMILYQEFYASSMEPGQRVSDYVAKVEFIAKKLRNSGASLNEETLISKVVTGLSQEYKHFMTSWMGTPAAERTFNNLLPRLLAEESIIKPEQKKETVAMKMTANSKPKNFKKKDIVCHHCGKKGHIKRDCRALKRETAAETAGQEDKKKFAIMARTTATRHNSGWLVDSGASSHMTSDRNVLDNYKALPKKVPIKVGNSEYVYGVGTGSITVISTVDDEQFEVTISDVMHVPGISDNLFSAGMADEKGLKLLAAGGRMDIIYRGNVIMVGHKAEGSNIYILDIQVPAKAYVAREERTEEEWHRVLGHPGVGEIRNLQRKGCTRGFKVITQSLIEKCGDCQVGKAHQVSHPSSLRERATETLQRTHVDLVGPVNPSSLGGTRYFLLARDEFSTYLHVYFLASKTQVVDIMRRYVTETSVATQKKVKILRSDNGSEFRNVAMTQLCQSEGIIQEFSSPHTPQQNGEIERANRTIIESARAMLQASGLPLSLWGEAVNTAVFLKNRLTNKRTADKTPYEIFYGRQPDYSYLIEFGQEVHVLDKSHHLTKFEPKTVEAYMVGYGDRANTYRCYHQRKDDVMITSDVFVAPHSKKTSNHQSDQVFSTFVIDGYTDGELFPDNDHDEHHDAHQVSHQNEHQDEHINSNPNCENILEVESVNNEIAYTNSSSTQPERASEMPASERAPIESSMAHQTSASQTAPVRNIRPAARIVVNRRVTQASEPTRPRQTLYPDTIRRQCVPAPASQISRSTPNVVLHMPRQPVVSAPANTQSATASSSGAESLTPQRLLNRLRPAFNSLVRKSPTSESTINRNLSATVEFEPTSYDDALSCADKDKWKIAICEELAAHSDNETWELVPRRANMREITAKWIFKIKNDSEGKRYKARLVARGFSQREGADYSEIFAPVVRMDSVRLLFSLTAQLNLKFKQFDITTAFLNGEIAEELYLSPPEGLKISVNQTCRLKRSLYGLKQAPRCWNAKFTQRLKAYGMFATLSDPCVYVTKKEPIIYLALYVDDGLVFGQEDSDIYHLLEYLKKHFKVKEINSSCFLGLEIARAPDGSIFLHQTKYIERVLHKYNMADCKGKPTPLEAGHALNKPETLKDSIIEGIPYAELVGSLLYCSIATRPDISYPLSVLSKYTSQPREIHWQALKRVVRYLSETRTFGLSFQQVEDPKLLCYTDADYAGDHQNRRSTSGMVTFLASGPIGYKAQQQSTVALSTTEAEYIASAIAAKELVWLQRFLEELNVELRHSPELLCDNQSALRLIKNPEFHQRSKHIDVAYHYVRDKYEEGLFVLNYVSSEEQKADIFTKAFTTSRFRDLRDAISCVKVEVRSS